MTRRLLLGTAALSILGTVHARSAMNTAAPEPKKPPKDDGDRKPYDDPH